MTGVRRRGSGAVVPWQSGVHPSGHLAIWLTLLLAFAVGACARSLPKAIGTSPTSPSPSPTSNTVMLIELDLPVGWSITGRSDDGSIEGIRSACRYEGDHHEDPDGLPPGCWKADIGPGVKLDPTEEQVSVAQQCEQPPTTEKRVIECGTWNLGGVRWSWILTHEAFPGWWPSRDLYTEATVNGFVYSATGFIADGQDSDRGLAELRKIFKSFRLR